jgi:hypothetical protein
MTTAPGLHHLLTPLSPMQYMCHPVLIFVLQCHASCVILHVSCTIWCQSCLTVTCNRIDSSMSVVKLYEEAEETYDNWSRWNPAAGCSSPVYLSHHTLWCMQELAWWIIHGSMKCVKFVTCMKNWSKWTAHIKWSSANSCQLWKFLKFACKCYHCSTITFLPSKACLWCAKWIIHCTSPWGNTETTNNSVMGLSLNVIPVCSSDVKLFEQKLGGIQRNSVWSHYSAPFELPATRVHWQNIIKL